MDGMHRVDFIKGVGDKVEVICWSADIDCWQQLAELGVIYSLSKPTSFATFCRVVGRAVDRISNGELFILGYDSSTSHPEETYPFMNAKNGQVAVIHFCEIDYVSGTNKAVVLHHDAGEITEEEVPLEDIEKLLPEDSYMRVRRSFIVARYRVKTFDNEKRQIFLTKACKQTDEIPVGELYYDRVKLLLSHKINLG